MERDRPLRSATHCLAQSCCHWSKLCHGADSESNAPELGANRFESLTASDDSGHGYPLDFPPNSNVGTPMFVNCVIYPPLFSS